MNNLPFQTKTASLLHQSRISEIHPNDLTQMRQYG